MPNLIKKSWTVSTPDALFLSRPHRMGDLTESNLNFPPPKTDTCACNPNSKITSYINGTQNYFDCFVRDFSN